jgi:hypothetical protein
MDLFMTTFLKFWYTIAIVFVLTRFLYYPGNGKREFLFTYLLLATIIALLCILILRVELSFGLALGIFAIFSLIRYRTEPISPREMTYIFLSTGIAAKNMLAPDDIPFYKILITDGAISLVAGLSEYFLFRSKLISKVIIYDNLNLIHPDMRRELESDLNAKYGMKEITKIRVGRIDATKNSARLLVSLKDAENNFVEE